MPTSKVYSVVVSFMFVCSTLLLAFPDKDGAEFGDTVAGIGNSELTVSCMNNDKLKLGNFSVSLAVKDIDASVSFYKKLGFEKVGGNLEHNYLIVQNDTTTIGLFQGMFESNLMTFNPGWNHKSETLDEFQDVREIQATLVEKGITPVKAAEKDGNGPASFVVSDPDGNMILIDQHVSKPE